MSRNLADQENPEKNYSMVTRQKKEEYYNGKSYTYYI